MQPNFDHQDFLKIKTEDTCYDKAIFGLEVKILIGFATSDKKKFAGGRVITVYITTKFFAPSISRLVKTDELAPWVLKSCCQVLFS